VVVGKLEVVILFVEIELVVYFVVEEYSFDSFIGELRLVIMLLF
jgi:hypothetical protein